jgi:hypothetical protein
MLAILQLVSQALKEHVEIQCLTQLDRVYGGPTDIGLFRQAYSQTRIDKRFLPHYASLPNKDSTTTVDSGMSRCGDITTSKRCFTMQPHS